MPLAAQGHIAGIQPGHVEQIADQSGQAGRLLVHGLRRFQRGRRQGRADQEQRIGEPDQRRQRCAQVVREGGQDRTAQPFRDHVELRGLRHIDVVQALDGDGDQRCQRFEQGDGLRRQIGRVRREGDGQHAAHAHRGAQRQVERSVAGAGDFTVADHLPAVLDHPGKVRLDPEGECRQSRCRDRCVVFRQDDRPVGVQLGADELPGDVDYLFERERSRQLACHVVEGLRALHANLRFVCLLLEAGCQLADDEGGRQHHREGHQVLDIVHRQREARRHEKDVEQENAQNRRQYGGAAAQTDGDEQYREQEKHHDIGEVEMAEQRCRQQRRGGTCQHREQDALPGFAAFCGFHDRFAFVLHDSLPVIQCFQTMPTRVKTLTILARQT